MAFNGKDMYKYVIEMVPVECATVEERAKSLLRRPPMGIIENKWFRSHRLLRL